MTTGVRGLFFILVFVLGGCLSGPRGGSSSVGNDNGSSATAATSGPKGNGDVYLGDDLKERVETTFKKLEATLDGLLRSLPNDPDIATTLANTCEGIPSFECATFFRIPLSQRDSAARKLLDLSQQYDRSFRGKITFSFRTRLPDSSGDAGDSKAAAVLEGTTQILLLASAISDIDVTKPEGFRRLFGLLAHELTHIVPLESKGPVLRHDSDESNQLIALIAQLARKRYTLKYVPPPVLTLRSSSISFDLPVNPWGVAENPSGPIAIMADTAISNNVTFTASAGVSVSGGARPAAGQPFRFQAIVSTTGGLQMRVTSEDPETGLRTAKVFSFSSNPKYPAAHPMFRNRKEIGSQTYLFYSANPSEGPNAGYANEGSTHWLYSVPTEGCRLAVFRYMDAGRFRTGVTAVPRNGAAPPHLLGWSCDEQPPGVGPKPYWEFSYPGGTGSFANESDSRTHIPGGITQQTFLGFFPY